MHYKYRFLASELNNGFNSIDSRQESPYGLLVFEENGKNFFKTISEQGTSTTKYKLSFCEIIFDVKIGKVFFQPFAEGAAANPRYALIVPPIYEEETKRFSLLKKLKKIANNEERFFCCGGSMQGFFRPVFEKDAIQMAKEKGYKKFYYIGGQDGVYTVNIPKKLDRELGSVDQIRRNAVMQSLKEQRSVSYEFGSETFIVTLDEAKSLAPHYIKKSLNDLSYYAQELSKKIAMTEEDIKIIMATLSNIN